MFDIQSYGDKISTQQQRNIGKIKLQDYGAFLGDLHEKLHDFKQKLPVNSNLDAKLIKINHNGLEYATILDLVHSDNKLLSKILASLSSLLKEFQELTSESEKEYLSLIKYESTESKNAFAFNLLETLLKVISITDRSRQCIALLFRHLNSIIGTENRSNSTTKFPECLEILSEQLVCLITLDHLTKTEPIKEGMINYQRSLENWRRSRQLNLEKSKSLERCLQDINDKLLNKDLFNDTAEFCLKDQLNDPAGRNSNLNEEISAYLNQVLTELEKSDEHLYWSKLCLQANALAAFQHTLYGNIDKKNLRKLLDLNKKASVCNLTSHRLLYPEDFLLKQVPNLSKQINRNSIKIGRVQQLQTRSQNLINELLALSAQSVVNLLDFIRTSNMDTTNIDTKTLQTSMVTLIATVRLVKKINETITYTLNLHANESVPMTKSTLVLVCHLIEMLKCFQATMERNSLSIGHKIVLISQHLSYKALKKLHVLKQEHVSEKRYKNQELDIVSALEVCDIALRGPITKNRLMIAKLALSCSGINKEPLQDLRTVLNHMYLILNITDDLNKYFDCSFLFWHHGSLMKIYFDKLFGSRADFGRFSLMAKALNDYTDMSDNSLNVIKNCVKNSVVSPLNQLIEMNLRLQTHLHLQLPVTNPFKNYILINFEKIPKPLFGIDYTDLKQESENYLAETFYNLTSVVLYDWQTYGEMRKLAQLQYKIDTVKDNLPMQTLGQGIDVLEIMRNINAFVTSYGYNLNCQIFVEKQSSTKSINTIGITHIANSIRTHGIGITNTAVNFTYQLLQNKFYVFSQFMYDEQVKSRLIKDCKYFAEHRNELNEMYPYERAEKFNYGIKKLGLNEEGLSYLDLFRTLIAHIGNAMGYVRLVRSGVKRCLSEAGSFIPDYNVDVSDHFEDDKLSELTKKAGKAFAEDVDSLIRNFDEYTEYFKLFVDVFSSVFRSEKHLHLKNFFMIVPPLTINFIENCLVCKERLNKKNKDSACFTDDGFPIGLAFIIELLGQDEQLNSLHWFRSISNYFADKRKSIERQRASRSKDDDNLQKTLSLSESRLILFEREFQLLFFNYRSARIFFNR